MFCMKNRRALTKRKYALNAPTRAMRSTSQSQQCTGISLKWCLIANCQQKLTKPTVLSSLKKLEAH